METCICRCVQPQKYSCARCLSRGNIHEHSNNNTKKNVCWCCPLSTWTTLFPCCANQVQIDDFENTKTMKVALLNAPFVSNMRQILESILKASWVNRIFSKQQDRFHWLIIAGVKCAHLPSVFEIYPPDDIILLVANERRVKCILEIQLFCKASLGLVYVSVKYFVRDRRPIPAFKELPLFFHLLVEIFLSSKSIKFVDLKLRINYV